MTKVSFPTVLAAQALARRQKAALQVELRLPLYDQRFEEPPRSMETGEDEPDVLILEADGSFTEVRD